MEELFDLFDLFDRLESRGWVCLMKWDGERTRRKKTIFVSNPPTGQIFHGDFEDFQEAFAKLRVWLTEHEINEN